MLDERLGDAAEVGKTLRRMLAMESSPHRLRAAEATADGRDPALKSKLREFGLDAAAIDAEALTRVAFELGWPLASASFIETAPAAIVLGEQDVSFGFDSLVPASLPHLAILRDAAVFIEPLNGEPKWSTGGDFLVAHQSAGNGKRTGGPDATPDAAAGGRADCRRQQGLLIQGGDYAKEREQFGKAIGAHQGVAHRLANAATSLDAAELGIRKAAFTALPKAGGDGTPAPIFSHMAKAKAVEAGRLTATTVHQIFGGNGFAMEYNVQSFSRRIRNRSMRSDRPGRDLIKVARTMLDPARRDAVTLLWHHDVGLPIPVGPKPATSWLEGSPTRGATAVSSG